MRMILIVLCVLSIFSGLICILAWESRENAKPYNPPINCINGYQFIHGYNGSFTQILDSNGKGIPCQ